MEQRGKNQIDDMRAMVFIAVFLLSISCGALQCQASENEKFSALVIDNSSVKTYAYDFHLYTYTRPWYDVYKGWLGGSSIKKDILIKTGDTKLTIPFENIKEMEFEWHEIPTCTILTNENERIHGEPLRVGGWSLKGETNFGDFSLDANKVKK